MALIGLYYNKCNEFLLMDPIKICLALVQNVFISVKVTKTLIKGKKSETVHIINKQFHQSEELFSTHLAVIRGKSNSAFNYLRTFYTLLFYAWKKGVAAPRFFWNPREETGLCFCVGQLRNSR